MALVNELGDVAVVQSTGDEEDEVVNHVGVGEVVEEDAQRTNGLGADEAKLVDELLGRMLRNGLCGEGSGLVLKEAAVVGGLQTRNGGGLFGMSEYRCNTPNWDFRAMRDAIAKKTGSGRTGVMQTYGEVHSDIIKRLALGESDEVGGGEESL